MAAETATGLLVPHHELNILKREIMVLSGVVHPETERKMGLVSSQCRQQGVWTEPAKLRVGLHFYCKGKLLSQ